MISISPSLERSGVKKLTYAAINDWNSLNKKVRSITSDLSFKTEMKHYFR